ncbi:MAG: zf-HC2 domain-containing protein [Anaerolineales bacterium]|nr:zf-HC2 domain-containing protein [Anaerolineales bacterium]
MCENMPTLLNAYLDGELHGQRRLEVKKHLVSCAACRNDLQELRTVSDLLRAAPAPAFLPVERFVAQLILRLNAQDIALQLPRRALRDRSPKPDSWAGWLVPAGLLGVWFFLRTIFTLTTAISAADASGLLGQASAWFTGGQTQAAWFAAITSLFGGQMSAAQQSTLSLFNQVSVFGGDLFSGFLWQAVVVLLYWGWLAAWWFRHAPQPARVTTAPSQS